MFENVARLEIEIGGEAAVRILEYVASDDGEPGMAAPADGDPMASLADGDPMASLGRHSWHKRRGVVEPDCGLCSEQGSAQASAQAGSMPPERGERSSERSSAGAILPYRERSTTTPGEVCPPSAPPRPDRDALRHHWRWKHISPRVEGLLEHLARSPLTGPDLESGRRWVAGIVRGTPKSKRREQQLVSAFVALGPPPPASERRAMDDALNPPDANLDRLMRLLRRYPMGGQLEALSSFEAELGPERVGRELDELIAAGVSARPDPYAAVRDQLRAACEQRRAQTRREHAVFGKAGRPLELGADQYDAKVRRSAPPEEVPHG